MSGGFYGEWAEDAQDLTRAATLATLRRYSEVIGAADPYDGEGVTQSDMLKLSQGTAWINEAFSGYLEQGPNFETRPLASETISPAHITQGTVGSCVMLATLIGCSANRSWANYDLVQSDEPVQRVTFPDGSQETVTEPTLAERFYHARGLEGERWPAVLEKAMGQKLFHEKRSGERSLRSAIDGIEPERALEILTGRGAVKMSLDEMSPQQVRQQLAELVKRGGPVICGSRPRALGDFISVEELHNGIVNSHCYAVVGFDGETVTLRNPWHRKEWQRRRRR